MAVKVDRRVVLAGLLGAWSPSPAQPTGNIIYMSATGDDANNGAFDTPVRTAGRATDLCAPGGTVYVRGGIYSGNQTISKNGLAGQKITMRPYPGETVIFDGTNSDAESNLITIFSDYFIFMGFTVRNGKFANISCFDTHDTEIRNCIIHDAWVNGVQIKALNNNKTSSYANIVEGNEIYNCVKENAPRTQSGGWGQALSFGESNNSVARNNFVHNNMGEGIVSIVSKGCLIEDNHIRDNYSVQIYLDNAPNTTVRRNRIWHTHAEPWYRYFNGIGYPGQGIQIANEDYGEGNYLPSDGIAVTNNFIGGCGDPAVRYAGYQLGGGLTNSTITRNTIYSKPEPVRDMTPAWSRPTT